MRDSATLQDFQQICPAHRSESMSSAGNNFTLEVNIDVIPISELLGHFIMNLWIGEPDP